jgi:hypothetical protein
MTSKLYGLPRVFYGLGNGDFNIKTVWRQMVRLQINNWKEIGRKRSLRNQGNIKALAWQD